jgi:feruloyl esterase
MMHCGAGAGPNLFGNILDFAPAQGADHNIFLSLQRWVEDGVEPEYIIATKKLDAPATGLEMTRPLCPYPQQARWIGKGNPADASNWKCQAIIRR